MARNNEVRRHLLPIYPHIEEKDDSCLLLTNVPRTYNTLRYDCVHCLNLESYLNEEQVNVRKTYGYYQPLAPVQATNGVERRLAFLSRLWNIDYNILKFNLRRLIKIANLFGANRIHRFSMAHNEVYLYEYDYYLALEFYLQIDRHLFHMKTCTYNNATRSYNEISLLSMCEPQVRYGMNRCGQTYCRLCHPLYKLTYRLDTPVVQFGPYQQHQFPNNYCTILNCPTTCATRNIIYVLTCPCQQVHYIGETHMCLSQRLVFHQRHGNRIMQEALLGQTNIQRIRGEIKTNETLTKDSMALYQHSTQCVHALQWFVDENPEYWPFIPTRNNAENLDKQSTENVQFNYADDVPQPPANYHFTCEQMMDMENFFHEKKYLGSPNLHLDLYQAAIIAVLPNFGSDAVRRFIEALFITHTDAKLNRDGHLDELLYPDCITHVNEEHHCAYENLIRR